MKVCSALLNLIKVFSFIQELYQSHIANPRPMNKVKFTLGIGWLTTTIVDSRTQEKGLPEHSRGGTRYQPAFIFLWDVRQLSLAKQSIMILPLNKSCYSSGFLQNRVI